MFEPFRNYLIVDLLKAYAWPLAIGIVAIIYRPYLGQLIPRIKKAGPAGVEFEPPQQQDTADKDVVGEAGKIVSVQSLPALRPALAKIEENLFRNLENIEESNRIKILVRELTITRAEAAFERIYGLIFGSQIAGLEKLNERGAVTIEDAEAFFRDYDEKYPGIYSKGFSGWIGYIVNQELVEIISSKLLITETGREFLLFITDTRKTKDKGL